MLNANGKRPLAIDAPRASGCEGGGGEADSTSPLTCGKRQAKPNFLIAAGECTP